MVIMMKKTIIFGLLAAALAQTAYAGSISAVQNGGTVNISVEAEADTEYIFAVYKPGRESDGITAESISDILSRVDEITTDGNGTAEFSYALEDKESGIYTAVAKNGDEILKTVFGYISPEDEAYAVETVNKTSGDAAYEDMYRVYEEIKDKLMLDDTLFENLGESGKAELLKSVMQRSDYTSAAEISEAYTKSALLTNINESDDMNFLESMIEKYNDILKFETDNDLHKNYIKTADGERRILERTAKGKYASLEEAAAAYAENTLLEAVNSAESYGIVHDMLYNNRELIPGIDFAKYDKLTAAQKKKADSAIAGKSFDTAADLLKAFNDAVNNAPSDSGSGSSSGGGGSSGGGKSSVTPNITASFDSVKKSEEKLSVFEDIKGFEWARTAIESLYKKGIVNGKSKTEFAPSDSVTRAEFSKMICLAAELKPGGARKFFDVGADDWFYDYTMKMDGIINGYPDGTFRPNDNITRQDAAVIICRTLEKMGFDINTEEADGFTDSAEFADYSLKSALYLKGEGIISGMTDGSFKPNAYAARAEAAEIIYRFYGKISK